MSMLQSLGVIIGVIILGYLIKQYKGKRGKPVDLFPSQELTGGLKEFQFEELLEKCKEDPAQFLNEYKDTPVLVVGTVNKVEEGKGNQKGMLSIEMDARPKGWVTFTINLPEFQVLKGQKVRVLVYISEFLLIYKAKGLPSGGVFIHIYGLSRKPNLHTISLSLEEEEVYILPAGSFDCARYMNFATCDNTLISAELQNTERKFYKMNFYFDSYLGKAELAQIFGQPDRTVKIKGKKGIYCLKHCEILDIS